MTHTFEASGASIEALDGTPDTFLVRATKVGAGIHRLSDKKRFTWAQAAIDSTKGTWIGGKVSINHNDKDYGRITGESIEGDTVKLNIGVEPWLAAWIRANPQLVGVSVETDDTEVDEATSTLTKTRGTGVTIIFPPAKPACSPEQGCGFGGADPTEKESSAKAHGAKDEKMSENAAPNVEFEAMKVKMLASDAEMGGLKSENLALKAEIVDLKAFRAQVEDDARQGAFATLSERIGAESAVAFKDEKVCTLRKMIAGLDASAKMQGSGATVGNDEKKKAEAAKHPGYSDEEFAEYEKAVILAAAQGVKL